MNYLLYVILFILTLIFVKFSCDFNLYYIVTKENFIAKILLFVAVIVIIVRSYRQNNIIEGNTNNDMTDAEKDEMIDAIIIQIQKKKNKDEADTTKQTARDDWDNDNTQAKKTAYDNAEAKLETADEELQKAILNAEKYDRFFRDSNFTIIRRKMIVEYDDKLQECKNDSSNSSTSCDSVASDSAKVRGREEIDHYFNTEQNSSNVEFNICEDELRKLEPIYTVEIAKDISEYNLNMTDLRQQINDKNITLSADQIKNKISGLESNNAKLQRKVHDYIAFRKSNCEMDTDNDGEITNTESSNAFNNSFNAAFDGFTNQFSKNTIRETFETLKQDQKFLENMDNQYNKTKNDIETDLIKNEYRTGAYALGIVIVGVLIVSRFQNK